MRFFEKITNYFTSNFFNNTKLRNQTLGQLKLLFERANKNYNPVNAFGNVFRNSKWSDLKVINVKESFTDLYSRRYAWAITGIVLMLLAISISIYVGAFDGVLDWLGYTRDRRLQILTLLTTPYLALKVAVRSKLVELQRRVFGLELPPSDEATLDKTKSGTHINAAYNHLRRSHALSATSPHSPHHYWAVLSYKLDRLKSKLQWLRADYAGFRSSKRAWPSTWSSILNPTQLQFTHQRISKPYVYRPDRQSLIESTHVLGRVTREPVTLIITTQGVTSGLLTGLTKVHTLFTNPKELAHITKSSTQLDPLTLNVLTGLDFSKQDRWLMRTSLNSPQLTNQNSAFTQTKRLLGTNLFFSDVAASNIWLSVRFNNLEHGEAVGVSSAALESLYPSLVPIRNTALSSTNLMKSSLENFNFIEQSRLWTYTRYATVTGMDSIPYTINALTPQRSLDSTVVTSGQSYADLLIAAQSVSVDLNLRSLNLMLTGVPTPPRAVLLYGHQSDHNLKTLIPTLDVLTVRNLDTTRELGTSTTTRRKARQASIITTQQPALKRLV